MKFSYKLKKLVSGEGIASARRRLRYWRHARAPLSLDAVRITRTIDEEKFRDIQRRYWVDNPGDDWQKYLELEKWMEINLRRVRDIELDLGPKRRVLDIGCGTGYFLYICKYLGHDVLGLDLDWEPGFREMCDLLGVPRRIWQVEAYVPLPADLGIFHVIAAHMICFNGHKSDKLWGPNEWEFFLNDCGTHLTPDGIIALELNREWDGSLYTPELKAYFENRGADIHTQRVVFNPLRPAPVATAPASR